MVPHFRERVRERIGPDVDPKTLRGAILWAIENDRRDLVAFIRRTKRRDGVRRFFRFRVPDGRFFVALTDEDCREVLTVMPDEWVK